MIDRVRERDAFVRLRRDGVRVRADSLWCSFVLDPDLAPPQVAFAIGRAVGSAVSRNRLRRRLRAVLANSDVPPGLYLVGARVPACEHTFAEVELAAAELMRKVRRHQETVRRHQETVRRHQETVRRHQETVRSDQGLPT